MRVLMIGDVVGRPGRNLLRRVLPRLKKERDIQFVICNGENAAGGFGLTAPVAEELFAMGIDVLTSGNHIWDKREIYQFLEEDPRVLRPENYPPGVPGRGWGVFQCDNVPICVMNLAGRVFMGELDCPFRAATDVLGQIANRTPVVVVDFHAEATAEKVAMGWHLDGKVSAVVGTHTHVQTADARVLPQGTAYITDLGMTGPIDSVIGVRREIILERFHNQLPARFVVAGGPVVLGAMIIDIDPASGKARRIERIWEVNEETK